MRQKLLTLLLVMTLAFGGLTACGGDGDDDDDNGVVPNGQVENGDDEGDDD